MKFSKIIKWSSIVIFCVLLFMIFTPVPQATDSNTYQLSATVLEVKEGTLNDIVFILQQGKKTPYINRGLERGLSIDELNQKIKGKNVTLKLIDHWTPLDYDKSHPTLAYIETESGEILFNSMLPS